MQIHPLSPVVGAEVHGVDLGAEMRDDGFAALHRAFLDHGVLVFREQNQLTPDAQVRFARRFGPLHTHPAAPADDATGAEGAIFVIHAHRDSTVANGNGWHTDVSCDEEPPMATMLQIFQPPAGGGGDTIFASMEAAFATLDESTRQRLRTLTARHESEHVFKGRYEDRGVDDGEIACPSAVHPVVRTHPETQRPSLYINRSFTTQLLDAGPDGDEVLRALFDHIERPEFQVRVSWNRNDVVLWDNRCLQHFAIWHYWPNERKGHRVSIAGDRPFFDPSAPGAAPSPIRMSIGALAPKPRGI